MSAPGMPYLFSVEARGQTWDVYGARKAGQPGTLAFVKIGSKWVIGLFASGALSAEEVARRIEQDTSLVLPGEP
jgi:hypothetical protein